MDSDLLIGRHPVQEALRAKRPIHSLHILEGPLQGPLKEIVFLAKQQDIPIKTTRRQKLDFMTNRANHQGIVAMVAAKPYVEWEDVLAMVWEKAETPLFVVLDQLEDPHNLGSILRTADVTNTHCIIVPKRRSVGLTSTVAKASTGAIEYIPVSRVSNLATTLDQLRDQGLQIIGTDASGEKTFRQVDWTEPTVLVIGSEGEGMRTLTTKKCDHVVSIPMGGHLNSLNASVSAGIVLYEAFSQRRG